eukprot:GHVN01044166.1.p1 GENE.GHVN01044166.1~~GHVN01044166.1.p1  ORF type:complete len:288 (+),score=42.87 GHVN01044166.1:421-1284(+)
MLSGLKSSGDKYLKALEIRATDHIIRMQESNETFMGNLVMFNTQQDDDLDEADIRNVFRILEGNNTQADVNALELLGAVHSLVKMLEPEIALFGVGPGMQVPASMHTTELYGDKLNRLLSEAHSQAMLVGKYQKTLLELRSNAKKIKRRQVHTINRLVGLQYRWGGFAAAAQYRMIMNELDALTNLKSVPVQENYATFTNDDFFTKGVPTYNMVHLPVVQTHYQFLAFKAQIEAHLMMIKRQARVVDQDEFLFSVISNDTVKGGRSSNWASVLPYNNGPVEWSLTVV